MRLSVSQFFNEIVSHPVPFDHHHPEGPQTVAPGPRSLPVVGLPDLPALTTLHSGSPGSRCIVSLDRTRPRPAIQVYSPCDFRYKVLRELKKIKLAWPDLNYATARGVLILLSLDPAHFPDP